MDSSEPIPTPRIRVAAAICDEAQQLLLVRHQKGDRSYWLLPGGGLEYGESARDATRREVFEETGLEIEVGRLLLVGESLAPDSSRHVVHLIFQAQQTGGNLRVGEDDRVVETCFVPLAGLDELVLHPPICRPLRETLSDSAPAGRFLECQWID